VTLARNVSTSCRCSLNWIASLLEWSRGLAESGGHRRTAENITKQRTSRSVAISQRSTWNANVLDCAFTRQRLRQRWPRSDDLPGEVDCGRNARGHVVVKLSNEAYYPRRCGDRRGRPPVEKRMEGERSCANPPSMHSTNNANDHYRAARRSTRRR
jgi:hypothetical protein